MTFPIDNASLSRRSLLGGLGAGALLSGSATASSLLGLDREAGDDKVLVVLQLSGGNDGLNTLVPFEDPEYRRARGRLALPRRDLHRVRAGLGMHPALKGLSQMYESGKLALIQGCGYPEPNRSHFKSMDIWHSADASGQDLRSGWLGRAMDSVEQRAADLAINVSTKTPLALRGAQYQPVSFRDPAAYRYTATKPVTDAFEKVAVLENEEARNPILAAVRRTAEEALETSREVRKLALAYKTPRAYPRQKVGSSLKSIAGLIAGGLKSRVYYAYHGGFDTHVNQASRHNNLLQQLDASLAAFQGDLERLGIADRVTVVVFSEFGRRVKANASGGTDHGVAGPMMVLGGRVRGGVYGEHPSLTDLNKGDLIHTTDFRSVYATLLDGWLGFDSKRVLREDFAKLDLFKA